MIRFDVSGEIFDVPKKFLARYPESWFGSILKASGLSVDGIEDDDNCLQNLDMLSRQLSDSLAEQRSIGADKPITAFRSSFPSFSTPSNHPNDDGKNSKHTETDSNNNDTHGQQRGGMKKSQSVGLQSLMGGTDFSSITEHNDNSDNDSDDADDDHDDCNGNANDTGSDESNITNNGNDGKDRHVFELGTPKEQLTQTTSIPAVDSQETNKRENRSPPGCRSLSFSSSTTTGTTTSTHTKEPEPILQVITLQNRNPILFRLVINYLKTEKIDFGVFRNILANPAPSTHSSPQSHHHNMPIPYLPRSASHPISSSSSSSSSSPLRHHPHTMMHQHGRAHVHPSPHIVYDGNVNGTHNYHHSNNSSNSSLMTTNFHFLNPSSIEDLDSIEKELNYYNLPKLLKRWRRCNIVTPTLSRHLNEHRYRGGFESAIFIGHHRSINHLDLSGADFRGACLRGVNLFNANLSNCNLENVDLSGANLIRANLNGARLVNSNLSHCNLNKASMRFCNLSFANLSRSDLRDAIFSSSNLTKANLTEVQCTINNQFNNANLSGALLKSMVLYELSLRHVNLTGASLRMVVLVGTENENYRNIFNNITWKDCRLTGVCFYNFTGSRSPASFLKNIASERFTIVTAKDYMPPHTKTSRGIVQTCKNESIRQNIKAQMAKLVIEK